MKPNQTITNPGTTKKKSWVPHTYVLIFCIILIAAAATYLIPAGVYDRITDPNTGRTIVDAASYKNVHKIRSNLSGSSRLFPKE